MLTAAEFQQAFDLELARSERGGHPLSLVVFRSADAAACDMTALARILGKRVRLADSVGTLDPRCIGVLLPYTDGAGAWLLADDVTRRVAREGSRVTCVVSTNGVPQPRSSQSSRRGGVAAGANGTAGTAVAASVNGRSDHVDGDRREGDDDQKKPRLRLRGQRTRQAAPSSEKEESEKLEHATVGVALNERPVGDLWEKFAKTLPPWKRAFDLFVSATLLIALAPLFGLIAAAIRLTSPGPIIFRQTRSGLGGRPFTLYKFRSMYIDAEARKAELMRLNEMDGPVFKMRDDPRTTPIGRRLRKWSLDELPQIFNVLKGDMTLVGPRPPLPDELRGYASWQRRRLSLTGGITCIWQVSGRNNIGFEDWMRMDMRYIRRRSAWLDARLLLQTVWSVLSNRGAY